jgi:hypothetical protein
MKCLLCDKTRKLVRSHIIPKAFFKHTYPKQQARIISVKKYSRKIPSGIYMNTICKYCEEIFSPWDSYGYQFFHKIIDSPSESHKTKNGVLNIYKNVDYKNLKMFLLSLLWRSVCIPA